MAPPEHRLKGLLGAAGSSGAAAQPQPTRGGKGAGSSGGSRVKAPAAGVGSSGGSREKAAGGGIAGSSSRNFSDTASRVSRESATRLAPAKKPGTALTVERMPPRPCLSAKAGGGLSAETPRKHQAFTGANGNTPRKHQAVTGSNRATTQKHHIEEKVGGGSSEQKMASKSCRTERASPSRQLCHPLSSRRPGTNTELPTAREKQKSKSRPSFPRETTLRANQKPRRTSSNDARASLGGNTAAHHSGQLMADEKRHLIEEMAIKVQEADLLIQQLNELGVGENIDREELQGYYEQLPCEPPDVDTSLELGDEEIKKLQVHHVLCRIKYYKVTQQGRKGDPHDAELADDYHLRRLKEKLKCFVEDETKMDGDHILDNLDKEGLLAYIEKDDMFDWSFQYLTVAALDDYQRLVPQNGGGYEYVHWDDYRMYFHKYEIELEYLDFWEELSKKLKWMEDYIHIGWPTLKWRRICSRGESQAMKIATGFSNITVRLARAAYYECVDSMNLEFCWYRQLDGVYFEIWKRVAKLKKSFREALEEVYKLDKFPLRQHVMKFALENNTFEMELQFRNCTEGITEEVTEEKAQDLIADAITKLRTRPKFYADYIGKKIEVARAIGIVSPVSP